MTRSEDITHHMRELIFGIRKDAEKIRTLVRRSNGLEVNRRRKIATRLDRIATRLDELAAFTLAG
jgi:hypothetical protein